MICYFLMIFFFSSNHIGVIAGLISVVFAKIVRWFSIDDTLLTRWRRNNPYKNAVYCGVLVALIGLVQVDSHLGMVIMRVN